MGGEGGVVGREGDLLQERGDLVVDELSVFMFIVDIIDSIQGDVD